MMIKGNFIFLSKESLTVFKPVIEWCIENGIEYDNIERSKIKYQVAKDKGFEIFEIWSDISYLDNIEFCKKIIRERI